MTLDIETFDPRTVDEESAEEWFGNLVYEATQMLETLERAGRLDGNGHHARRKIAEYAARELRRRWRTEATP